jgi:serine/threonine protein phosphatase 1
MTGRTIAFGDIHGCSKALDALLQTISPTADDRLVMLGDYVDRGPNSREVVERLLDLQAHCQLIPLRGNHELMLFRAFDTITDLFFWLNYGGQQTVDSYGGDLYAIPPDHLEFLRKCRPFYETDTHLFVHANYEYDLPLEAQRPNVLFWTHLNQRVPPPHFSGKTVVVGHTPQTNGEILHLGHLICLDTFCCGGGWLTAMDVDHRTLWQANREGELRTHQQPGTRPRSPAGPWSGA